MENTSSSNFTVSRGPGTSENSDMDLSSEDFRRRKTIGVIIRRGLKDWVVNCYDHLKYAIIESIRSLKVPVYDRYKYKMTEINTESIRSVL